MTYLCYGKAPLSRIRLSALERGRTIGIAAIRLVFAPERLEVENQLTSLQVQVHDPATWNPLWVAEFLPVPTAAAYRTAMPKAEDIKGMINFISTSANANHNEGGEDLTSPRLVLLISQRNGAGRSLMRKSEVKGTNQPL